MSKNKNNNTLVPSIQNNSKNAKLITKSGDLVQNQTGIKEIELPLLKNNPNIVIKDLSSKINQIIHSICSLIDEGEKNIKAKHPEKVFLPNNETLKYITNEGKEQDVELEWWTIETKLSKLVNSMTTQTSGTYYERVKKVLNELKKFYTVEISLSKDSNIVYKSTNNNIQKKRCVQIQNPLIRDIVNITENEESYINKGSKITRKRNETITFKVHPIFTMHHQRGEGVKYYASSREDLNHLLSEFKINYPEYSKYIKAIELLQLHGEKRSIYYHKKDKNNVMKESAYMLLTQIKIFSTKENKQTTYENFIKLLDILKKDKKLNFIQNYEIGYDNEDNPNFKKDYLKIFFNMGFYGKKFNVQK